MKSVYADSIAKMMRKYGFHSPDMEINEFVAECLPANNDVLSGWIPCSERMPEIDQSVLVYGTSSGGDVVIEVDWLGRYTHDWQYWNGILKITHWMPLPEPQGGDES